MKQTQISETETEVVRTGAACHRASPTARIRSTPLLHYRITFVAMKTAMPTTRARITIAIVTSVSTFDSLLRQDDARQTEQVLSQPLA